MLSNFQIDDLIRRSLEEDIGTGDITTNSTISVDRKIKGRFIAKETGIVCGLPIVKRVFELLDINIKLFYHVEEGGFVSKGEIVAEISGPFRYRNPNSRIGHPHFWDKSGHFRHKKNNTGASRARKIRCSYRWRLQPSLKPIRWYFN